MNNQLFLLLDMLLLSSKNRLEEVMGLDLYLEGTSSKVVSEMGQLLHNIAQ